MLRPIVQTRRKYNKGRWQATWKSEKRHWERKESQENSESETQEGSSIDTDRDQNSDVSFAEDSDKEIERGGPRFRVRSKCTEKWNGDWRWEQHRHQKNDGQGKQLNGTQDLVPKSRHAEQWVDWGKDGKTKEATFSNERKQKQRTAVT